MKQIFALVLFCLFSLALYAQPAADKLKGSVNNGKLVLNKKEISKEWKLQIMTDVLGTPEHTRDGYNKTHTYDRYGIVGFEPAPNKVPSGNLSELQVYFSEKEVNDVSPKGFYAGSFKVGKLKVTKDLTAEQLKKKIKGYTESDSYMPHNFRFAKDGIYIYFQFNDDETMLAKMSIGKDSR